jgi:hypothetical protein
MIGLTFRETMSGGYHLSTAPGDDRPMHFTLRAQAPSLRSLLGTALFEIQGSVYAERFAEHRPLRGSLHIDPLRGKVLVYMFDFEADDGARYSFQGRKTLGAGDLIQAMTVLPGGIFSAAGKEVGRALLRFDLRSDLLKFLRSFRLVRS